MERSTAGVTGMRLEDLFGGGGYCPPRALAAVMVGVDDEDVVERGMVVVAKASRAVPGSDAAMTRAFGSGRLRTGAKMSHTTMTAAAQRPAASRHGPVTSRRGVHRVGHVGG